MFVAMSVHTCPQLSEATYLSSRVDYCIKYGIWLGHLIILKVTRMHKTIMGIIEDRNEYPHKQDHDEIS